MSESGRGKPPKRLVILLHGINTEAPWQNTLIHVLEREGFTVVPTNYGHFPLLKFLVPVRRWRERPKVEVRGQIRDALDLHHDADTVCFIAHSFGTVVLHSILAEQLEWRIDRVILCGSVLSYTTPIGELRFLFDTDQVRMLNEVGTRDYWPIIATSVTWGYGAAGAFGFRRPPARDRWHTGLSHSQLEMGL